MLTRHPAQRASFLPLLLLSLLLCGCQLTPPPPERPPAPTPPAPVRPTEPGPEELEIRTLLRDAASALADDRLTSPPDNCAYYRYLRVLYLDPDNREAQVGLADIAERYLTWSIDAAQSRRFGQARIYLENARDVDAGHPNIPAVARRLDELQHSTTIRYRIPPDGLDERTAETARLLRRIAAEIAQLDAQVVITARNDAEGRWIYQQLNEATGTRVRAEMQIGIPPAIELLAPAS